MTDEVAGVDVINAEEMNIGRRAAVTLSQCSVVAMEYTELYPKVAAMCTRAMTSFIVNSRKVGKFVI